MALELSDHNRSLAVSDRHMHSGMLMQIEAFHRGMRAHARTATKCRRRFASSYIKASLVGISSSFIGQTVLNAFDIISYTLSSLGQPCLDTLSKLWRKRMPPTKKVGT